MNTSMPPTELNDNISCILYALYYAPNRKIRGKVNLNKIIAKLERLGANISPRLIKHQMGSYFDQADVAIAQAETNGWITKNYVSIDHGLLPRLDIELSNEGKQIIESQLTQINGYAKIDSLPNIIESIEKKTSAIASQEEHKELLLDDETKLKEKCSHIISKLKEIYQSLNNINFDDETLFDLKGIIQYVIFVLNKIHHQYFIQPSGEIIWGAYEMGWYYVIRISEELLSNITTLHKKSRDEWNLLALNEINRTYQIIKHLAIKYEVVEELNNLQKDAVYLKI